ncbi:uncharacterized protein N7483_011948 [Penicillium malachiteum]|uniref:uncharacterized protein n=1 Tax=Penicillium malachiteum TaxID=1324776 RepID=UPI00254775FA|nr:uncharacterized protein N7483_011948 [Penicillium malachiteum]KAJ5714767.1 hypothetical protein N7483_011948 [Penicillium malachiteum]
MSVLFWEENVNLQSYNTFNVKCVARWLVRVRNLDQLSHLVTSARFRENRHLILGGGSNILLGNSEYDGVILKSEIKGIEVETEDDQHIVLRIGGGVEWGSLVGYCLDNHLGGLENLSLIPGTVGAAPIQNIGAYGVELSDVLVCVETFDVDTGETRLMMKDECELGYRDSIFKHSLRSLMVCFVTIRVTKPGYHCLNTSYMSVQEVLLDRGISIPTIRSISEAVSLLRMKKLFDPKNIGNAGNFFKNVICDESMYRRIARIDANVPFYRRFDGMFVIPAAWLIERCGWKGREFDNVGVSRSHALVLVNLGRAQGREIVWLAGLIMRDVKAQLGLILTPEVNIVS